MRHAVIMAGGAGTRLWPLSRADLPKQLLRLGGRASLLRQSYERVAALLPPESIYVITGRDHLDLVARELPELPAANLFGEPVGRDTANAVGLAAAILKHRDADAVMGVFTADHVITPVEKCTAAVDRAFTAAERHPDALITMGIRPTRPETGYGYVKRGAALADGVFEVERFTEKPDVETARRYLAGGDYYWNSGMFTWRVDTVLHQLAAHLPASHAGLRDIAAVWDTPDRDARLEAVYPDLDKISIDFAVMEHAPRVLVVEMDCDWIDVGSWTALEAVLGADADGNVIATKSAVVLESHGNVLAGPDDHLIATLGVDDLVIVHSPDATLICRKADAQRLKDLVAEVHRRHGHRYQ
ncbi:MAG TPA: mannose-1-phosphate guanylyltransferase [Phycisphaerae bacterium]|nr:mannose-1-phosphate guanylyltransferase [Phycisphaerae bacterium]